jgi:CRISPR-associated endonuclease Cas1
VAPPFPDIPSFSRYLLRLRLHHSARLHFRHEVMLHSLLNEAMGKGAVPDSVVPFACESGRVDFEAEDEYRIGLTIVERNPVETKKRLERSFEAYASRGWQGDAIPMLRWFTVIGAEDVVTADSVDLLSRQRAAGGPAGGPPALLSLQFVSPLCIEIPGSKPHRYFDSACFPAEDFLRRVWGRFFFFEHGRPPNRAETEEQCPAIPAIVVDPSRLLWIDLPRMQKPALGGVLGRITITNPGPDWLLLLVAAQYLHIGKGTGDGFGAFRFVERRSDSPVRLHEKVGLESPTYVKPRYAPLWNDPFGPSRTLLERAAEMPRLEKAADDVLSGTKAGGADGVSPEMFSASRTEILPGIVKRLAAGTYAAAPLLGIVLPKGKSKLRALAVPTLTDRVVQRSVLGMLGPAIETLLEDCSFAYRKGFSRAGAAQAIEKAWNDGYRWVLDADIESFFDAVGWERLFAKFEALYPFEPLAAIVRGWVTAPVQFEGRLIQRTQGLPQGAVISPLLANLFLDELDEELLGADYRLVRYADDFVVLCRDLEAAERARDAAREALAHLGLTLQEDKTSIRSLDQGLSYLGYLFCRSVVLDGAEEAVESSEGAAAIVAPASWLAAIDLSRIRELRSDADHAKGTSGPRAVPLYPDDHDSSLLQPLYVTDPTAMLRLHHDTLRIEREGADAQEIPIRSLSLVVFTIRPRSTIPLIIELAARGIPSFFCKADGTLESIHGPFDPDPDAWLAQARASADEALRLPFVREIVAAKLHNYAVLMVRHELHDGDAGAAEIRGMERSIQNKTAVESIRGVEGAAGAVYFRCVARSLDRSWDFEGRERRPPPDPFNALLSYGYTLLHNHCATALYAAGLMPRIGLYHREHGAWAVLASDLQEEFRFLVDRLVWAMIHRREIGPDAFTRRDGGCFLDYERRRWFVAAFAERLEETFTPEGWEEAVSYRAAIGIQAKRLRAHLLGKAPYRAVRVHS